MGSFLALAKLYSLSEVGTINPISLRSWGEHAQFNRLSKMVAAVFAHRGEGRGKIGGNGGSRAGCG